jgi:hypothetical protein
MVMAEITKIMVVLAAAYPRFGVDETKCLLWYELLKDIPYELCQLGLKNYIMDNCFPPTISDINKVTSLIVSIAESPYNGEMAWKELMDAFRIYGCRRDEVYNCISCKTLAVVKKLGLAEIYLYKDKNNTENRFVSLYDSMDLINDKDAIKQITTLKRRELVV